MHDPTAEGTPAFFKCDFCASPWAEDRPMIEGHEGRLICSNCLALAYTTLAITDTGEPPTGWTCTMCLEERKQPGWRSPARDEAIVCLRCVKQAATQLDKDPDFEWKKPV